MMRSFSGSEYVHLKERGRGSQPDSTDHQPDQGAHGKDIVSSSSYQQSSHGSSWFPGLECQGRSQGFGQNSGHGHSEHSSKCDLSEDAGGCVGMTDEEQGAEDAQEEGDEQDMAESPVVGLD